MLYICIFATVSLVAILLHHLGKLVSEYRSEMKYLSSRKLRDLHKGVTCCVIAGLRKKDFKTRVYLQCIVVELASRGEKL